MVRRSRQCRLNVGVGRRSASRILRGRVMRWILCAATAATLVITARAEACAADPVTEAVIFDRPPAHRPAGYAVFKIIGRAVQSGQGHVLISVVEPAAGRRLAPSAWLAASPMSSCTTWGRFGREGYVVARFAGALRGRPIVEARTFKRSWLDFLWSRLGWETYRASGGPMPH